jgi:acyl-CoA thioesterase-1
MACEQDSATSEKPISEPIGTIVAMGDSLTEGLGVPEDLAYPARLEEALRSRGLLYNVVNAGISGETSSGARSRLEWVLTMEPDIIILETGANDGMRGLSPRLIKENIQHMIEAFIARDIVVLLVGMKIMPNLGPEYAAAFADIYTSMADEYNIIFMPFMLEGVAGVPLLNQPDGIHPTAEGYRIVAQKMLPYVLNAIDQRKQSG